MRILTRLARLNKVIYELIVRAPLFAILIGAIFGAIGYGGVMSLVLWFFGASYETAFWAALFFGFPAIFLIPSSINETWSTEATLALILIVQGAMYGILLGLLARSICLRKFPQDDIEDDLE